MKKLYEVAYDPDIGLVVLCDKCNPRNAHIIQNNGCEHCNYKGYKGRLTTAQYSGLILKEDKEVSKSF